MLKMNKRSHSFKNIESLINRLDKQPQRLIKNYPGADFTKTEYKALTNNIVISIENVRVQEVEFKHTNVYNIENKTVLCVSGICTLDIYEIPMIKELYI